MRLLFVFMTFVCISCGAQEEETSGLMDYAKQLPQIPDYILAFGGKGSAVGFDGGVVEAAYEFLPSTKRNRQILTGSSSGSISAAFFSCHGISPESIAEFSSVIKDFDKSVVNEDASEKFWPMFWGYSTATSIHGISQLLDKAQVDENCLPKLPVMIVAANHDVLNDKLKNFFNGGHNSALGRNDKIFDMKYFSVYEKKSTYWGFGRAQKGKYLGKGCTYFVTDELYDMFSGMSPRTRLCDLRRISNGSDMRRAVMASIAEPTYYPVQPELERKKLSISGPNKYRYYAGGFIMTHVIHDLKRFLPKTFSLGTGAYFYDYQSRMVIDAWYNVPLNEVTSHNKWWLDAEIAYDNDEFISTIMANRTPEQNYQDGYDLAKSCFQLQGHCVPERRKRPPTYRSIDNVSMHPYVNRGIYPMLRSTP